MEADQITVDQVEYIAQQAVKGIEGASYAALFVGMRPDSVIRGVYASIRIDDRIAETGATEPILGILNTVQQWLDDGLEIQIVCDSEVLFSTQDVQVNRQ